MSPKQASATLIAIAAITVLSMIMISKMKFDYDFEAFFPHKDPETEFYLNFRKDFETDNDFFIVVVENQKGIFDFDFLKKVDSLTKVLGDLPNVDEIQGPTTLVEFVKDPFIGTVFTQPIIRWQEKENYSIDSSKVFSTPGLVDVFFSEDRKSVAINMKHKQRMSKAACDQLSLDVEREVERFNFDGKHIIGRALGQRIYVDMMVRELAMFISISLLLTILFLFIAFRSGWGIVIPTLVVIISILWTLGAMKLLGKDIDLMITILPTIIFVVGMSDSVHVLTKYLQELRNGRDKVEAIKYAFKSIRLATFLTALTTSVGFLTLMLSDIKPVSDFGLYTSIGVMLAYGLTFTMLPAILLLAKPKRLYAFSTSEDFWLKKMHFVFRWILRRRKVVFISGLVIIAVGLYGISMLVVDNMMLEDLRDDHLLKKEFRYMEEHYSGVRPFEMAIFPKKGIDPFQKEFLTALDSLHYFLENNYGVGAQGSLSILVKTFNKASNGGQKEFYSIPEQAEINQIERILKRKSTREYLNLFYSDSSNVLRVTGKVGDIGRLYYEEKNRQLAEFISTNKLDTRFDYKVTGTAHLIDLNNQSLVDNMLADLLLSVLVVGLIMAVIYRSWKMLFLTIIPNVIPLLLVGGLMGYVGIPIKISTSIIFNIAFGIAVDDTIHFLARVRTLLGEGLSLPYAIKRTFLTTGKAMIITTLILCGGFMTLVLSNFLGTYYIGFLITLTLIIGVITELLFAPLVLLFFFRKK